MLAAELRNDVIKDFAATGRSHDVIQVQQERLRQFRKRSRRATQVGQMLSIRLTRANRSSLENPELTALDRQDFHFA